jgi:hypothetical protein
VEISNLDPAEVERDPQAIEKALIGVFVYYLKSLAPGEYNPELLRQVIANLNHYGVNFGFTTFNAKTAERIRALRPFDEYKFYYPPSDFKAEFPGQEWLGWGYNSPPRAFLFSVQQILALIQAHPEIYAQVLNSCREDKWARHLMLSDPDIF